MDIPSRIKAARECAGRTVADVARDADVDPVHLARFERAERDMTGGTLSRVLAALGLDVLPADHHGTSADTVAPAPVTDQPGSVT